jgi:hypothetical protein
MTLITVRPSYGKPVQEPRVLVTKGSSSPWHWMTLACLLLGISGGVRFWRDWQFAALAATIDRPPFNLMVIPRTMGDWASRVDEDGQLDPAVAAFAGSSDYIMRTYLDKKSGDKITALALYGQSVKVFGHSPDVCYPAAGYELVKEAVDREMSVPGLKGTIHYRWSIFMKRVNGISHYQETYHTFYFNGEWLADPKDQWKSFRYHPSMYRILIDRPVSGLSDEAHQPTEDLLRQFIREISSRISPNQAGGTENETPNSAKPEGGAR